MFFPPFLSSNVQILIPHGHIEPKIIINQRILCKFVDPDMFVGRQVCSRDENKSTIKNYKRDVEKTLTFSLFWVDLNKTKTHPTKMKLPIFNFRKLQAKMDCFCCGIATALACRNCKKRLCSMNCAMLNIHIDSCP